MMPTLRSHIIFVAGLLMATFGAGQLWSLARALRGGNMNSADLILGTLGLVLLLASVLVLGRILYLVSLKSRSIQSHQQEVYNETHSGSSKVDG